MALRLSRAISDGIRRTLSKTGVVLFVGLLIIQLGTQATVNAAAASYLPSEIASQGSFTPLTLPVSGTIALALFAALLVFSASFFVVIARSLAQSPTSGSSAPTTTRRLGRATFAMLVGGLVVSVSVAIGTMFLLLPGLFLATSFLFIVFTIAVEDHGVIGGLQRSWELASGSRFKLFLLVLLTTVFGGVVGGISAVLTLIGIPVAGTVEVINVVVTALFMTFYYGILTASYLQLRGDHEGVNRQSPDPVDASGTPEL